MSNDNKVVVGLSGGVDSSVAALLLKQQFDHVEGLFMKNWVDFADESECTVEEDRKDASSVAETVGIPFHEANFAMEYWDYVFKHFLDEYRAGRTPNPDILCNREIKFKTFLDHAIELGGDIIATGHYARVEERNGQFHLLKGQDHKKDQSYFLYTLGQEQLSRTRFPLGDLPKTEVRRIAEQAGFINHDKKDSTGICFIGERHFREFLSRYIPAQPGEMRTPEGEIIGDHAGLMYYTLGQRQGLGIGGRKDSTGEPWFVAGKDMDNQILYVVQGDHPWLWSQNLVAEELSWVAGHPPEFPCRAAAKTRYRQPDQACTITQDDNGNIHVEFDEKQRAVTPGQSVVFYLDDDCLGGGIIVSTDAPGIHP
ncbi:tRNA 2-thiouridine(34) synthase MnmA [Methylophaga thalassica]|jgi:tRNA-specific 2-thiouridylase|uniref:tRNA-specific 2-thiouridylase MnmA n=1 Tax=Methylophaga aminisulfidivorans MP TaxID=1026882 RepID=F5SX93_9GAMM|nr:MULTISPECIES: tRNA 2-thiouridine(34) synthase MnmA [Methylophaga]EGL55025.1 putative tRNA methyltransferase [Methylophaga aminisulfidivorans MP]WVI84293.1 tRNA 2-thiouridine(34) synthase MnmA [Methylophaga thalassica]